MVSSNENTSKSASNSKLYLNMFTSQPCSSDNSMSITVSLLSPSYYVCIFNTQLMDSR